MAKNIENLYQRPESLPDSKNGIFMRGHRVNEWHVRSGERFTVGQTEIIVRYAENAHAAIETEASEPQESSQHRAPETIELLY
jgi:hypothetical protein